MGQSWNGPAARSLLQVARNPSLINPSKSVRDISVVNVQELKDMGIKGLVLDKDNTITAPYSLQLHPRVKHATLHIQSAFPNKVSLFRIVVIHLFCHLFHVSCLMFPVSHLCPISWFLTSVKCQERCAL